MFRGLAIPSLVLGAFFASSACVVADETPTAPSNNTTTPSTNSSTTTTPEHKTHATEIFDGTVSKISDKSITLKANIKKKEGPSALYPKGRVVTTTQTMSIEIGETPLVKVIQNGKRTTGSFADVKVGDQVSVGTAPKKTTNSEGKSVTHKQVTGIDVYKHDGNGTTTTTTTTTKKN